MKSLQEIPRAYRKQAEKAFTKHFDMWNKFKWSPEIQFIPEKPAEKGFVNQGKKSTLVFIPMPDNAYLGASHQGFHAQIKIPYVELVNAPEIFGSLLQCCINSKKEFEAKK